jgi:hypothetical protein
MERDGDGTTAAHVAATSAQTMRAVKHFLTSEMLAAKDADGLNYNFNLSGVNSPPLAAYGMIDLF